MKKKFTNYLKMHKLFITLVMLLILSILCLTAFSILNTIIRNEELRQDPISYAVDEQTISYPVVQPASYNITETLVEEQKEIVPLNADQLTKIVNTEHYCGDNDQSNLGIVMYWLSTGTFAEHNENRKTFITNNRNTVVGINEEKDFNQVIDFIDGKYEIRSIENLPAFNYSCTGPGAVSFIKTFNVEFPTVEKSLASISVGGTQYVWKRLSDVKFTLKILSQKGDNVMLMSEYFEGSELFTEEEVQTCSTKSEYDNYYLPLECIRDLYKQTPSIQYKVNQKAQDLIKFFEF